MYCVKSNKPKLYITGTNPGADLPHSMKSSQEKFSFQIPSTDDR